MKLQAAVLLEDSGLHFGSPRKKERLEACVAPVNVASCPVLHNQNLQKFGDQILGI